MCVLWLEFILYMYIELVTQPTIQSSYSVVLTSEVLTLSLSSILPSLHLSEWCIWYTEKHAGW